MLYPKPFQEVLAAIEEEKADVFVMGAKSWKFFPSYRESLIMQARDRSRKINSRK